MEGPVTAVASLTSYDIRLYGGLAMAAVGALILLAVVMGSACGLFVLMFNICSGRAQFARKQRRRSAQHRVMVGYPNGDSSPASYLSSPVLGDTTEPLEAVKPDEQD